MSYPDRFLEQEEDRLTEELNNGLISDAEYNKAMRELHAEYREMALGAAQDAYEREMDRW
jgi:hypothetical protein